MNIDQIKKAIKTEQNDISLYNLCKDFISEIDFECQRLKEIELKEKQAKIKVGTKFKTWISDAGYVITKVKGNRVYFNWNSDKEGTNENIDHVISLFQRGVWIKKD